ncbi:LPP20 family lipoprotein [Sulfurimonas sp.]|uniref:LPP20 family lipoprotein n=1 Tax=Sulfurimonas sp. TaxID=2022749 RepID=UPI002AB2ADB7|nr:LPP20 family lipoprotein [Sulfurimonas sp.]
MQIKTLFLLLTITFFSACGVSASPSVNSAALSWLNNPPSDTSRYFYAVGYGDTQKDAKSDALGVISAKISVDVASNFSNSLTASRQDGNEDILQTTKNEVVSKSKNIEYSDVKVQESLNEGAKWTLLVQVDRNILTATYERKLQKVDDKIKVEWEIYQDAGYFEKLKLSSVINKYLKQTDTFFPLLHALNTSYDDSKYTSRYLTYTKEMRKAKSELVFKIKSDKNSESLASLIRSELSAQNATFNNTNYNVLIKITTKAKMRKVNSTNEEFKKITIALRKTVIKATDRKGNVVSNVMYKTKAGSSDGFADAIARVAKYEAMIEKKGIISFITGN